MKLLENWTVPQVEFKVRVAGEWVHMLTDDYFKNKKVIVFSLPGAFTPTCSEHQLPGFQAHYKKFKELGIDEIYCISVNDSFVRNDWFDNQQITDIKGIPDGSVKFTRAMGMLVEKDDKGFGYRSWRYAMVVDNGVITNFFEEPGLKDNCTSDPYGESSPENVLKCLS